MYLLVFQGNPTEHNRVFEQSFTILMESLLESTRSLSDNLLYHCIRISGETSGSARHL